MSCFFLIFFFMLSSEIFLAGLIEPKDQCVFVDKGYLLVKVFVERPKRLFLKSLELNLLSYSMFLMFFLQ